MAEIGERAMLKYCPDCDAVYDEFQSEPEPGYDCGNCGTTFTRSGSYNDNHQCPDCLKFSSKFTDEACLDCVIELEEDEFVWNGEEWVHEDTWEYGNRAAENGGEALSATNPQLDLADEEAVRVKIAGLDLSKYDQNSPLVKTAKRERYIILRDHAGEFEGEDVEDL